MTSGRNEPFTTSADLVVGVDGQELRLRANFVTRKVVLGLIILELKDGNNDVIAEIVQPTYWVSRIVLSSGKAKGGVGVFWLLILILLALAFPQFGVLVVAIFVLAIIVKMLEAWVAQHRPKVVTYVHVHGGHRGYSNAAHIATLTYGRRYSNGHLRQRIPTAVKQAVWLRDGGVCVECGATDNLQFDHELPVAKGGSSTIENVRLLCQSCNLAKGSKIA